MNKLSLILLICLVLLTSCSSRRVLVLTDPVIENLAASQSSLHFVNRLLIYLGNGFIPRFIDKAYPETAETAQNAIDSGKFSALITNYPDYYNLDIPAEMDAVLIGGTGEIRFPSLSHIILSDTDALEQAGSVLLKKWKREQKNPVILLWQYSRTGDKELEPLLSAWSPEDRHVVEENLLLLNRDDKDIQNKIDSFLRRYNFSDHKYVIAGICSPVMDLLLNSLPDDENTELILSIPDNPYLPEQVVGIITPSYKMIQKAGVNALKVYSPGDLIEIQNIYINK